MGLFRRRQPAEKQRPAASGGTAPPPPDQAARGEDDCSADYVTDAPIADVQKDRFGRRHWAHRVAVTIAAQRDPASLVVGIYGPWGDGKTSVLNFIQGELDETPGVVPVRFNPWRLGDETEMFRGFFATLAEALDERVASAGERIGETLRDYGGLLVAVPVFGAALKEGAGAAGAKLSETNMAKEREKIEDLLARHGKRVVILIDDIDRLDKSEIQAMFRLVKVAADFQHTAYVLAFDDRVVASALAERYADEPTHGTSFMDKIIQLPLHLPSAPAEVLRAIALESVDAALAQAGIELTESEAASLVSAFDRAIGPRLKTPRAAKRYGNALLFALPMMADEVNPVDLMLVEAMRICYPSLYEWVKTHEREVLGAYSASGSRDESALASIRAAVENATQALSVDDAARAKTLLTTLLPRTESAWENKQWGTDWDGRWAQEKRMASKLYFRRYLTYGVPPGDVPDADLDALLAEVERPEPDTGKVTSLAAAVLATNGADAVLPKLAARVPTLGPDAAAHLAMVLTALSAQFPDKSGFLGLSTLERAAVLVRDLFGRVRPDERGELAVTLMRSAQHLPFAIELLVWLRPQEGDQEHAYITSQDCDAAGRVLADRLLEVWCSEDPSTRLMSKTSASLHVCATYGDGDELRECLRRRVDEDLATAFAIIRAFLGRGWSMETGVPFVPDLRRESYDAVAEYIEPSWLYPRLRERFGDAIGAGEEHSRRASGEDERLADQYARFYRADLNKKADESENTGD